MLFRSKNSKSGASPEGPFPAEPDPKTGKLPLVTRGARKGLPVSDRLQYYHKGQPMAPMSRHSYLAYLPTVEFGPGMTSGSEIRNAWPKLNERRKTALVMSLYPRTQVDPKLAANVVKMLDTAIGTEVTETRQEPQDPELHRARAYARGHYTGVQDDPELAFDKWVQRSLMHSSQDDKLQDQILKVLSGKVDALEKQIQQLQKPMGENQGWAATFTNEADGITTGTGVTGGMTASYQNRYNQPVDEAKIHFSDPRTPVNLYYITPKLQAQGRVQNIAHNIPYSTVMPLIKRLQEKYPNMNSEYMVWYPLGHDRYGKRLSEQSDYIEESCKK